MGTSLSRTIYDTAGAYVFTPPDPAIQVVWADIWGAGAGGNGSRSYGAAGNAGGGGGAGEFIERKLIPIEGGSLAIKVGAGGVGGIHTPTGTLAGDGGYSSVGNIIALGGLGPKGSGGGAFGSGSGGGVSGGSGTGSTRPPLSAKGRPETPNETGGWSGGGGGNRSGGSETQPKDCPGTPFDATSGSGGGGAGASSMWGPGGTGPANGSVAVAGVDAPATSNGAGGGGASTDGSGGATGKDGGKGADGKVVLYYLVIT